MKGAFGVPIFPIKKKKQFAGEPRSYLVSQPSTSLFFIYDYVLVSVPKDIHITF